jgi:K+-transporting ATPase ATPase C chain
LLTGCIFPLLLFAVGRFAFPDQTAGSLVTRSGIVAGSRLIGQQFTRPEYFHPRPSAAGSGYDGTASGGTSLGPSNPRLIESVRKSAEAYRKSNGLAPDTVVPIDAVTSSGSGLDPHISPEDAALQVPRVAHARGLNDDAVRSLVSSYTQGRQFGLLGSPRVAVLELNIALDRTAQAARR